MIKHTNWHVAAEGVQIMQTDASQTSTLPDRQLVIVRHAPYEYCHGRDALTAAGQELAHRCAQKIYDLVGCGSTVVILTSNQARSVDTGAIIAETLSANHKVAPWLTDAGWNAPNIKLASLPDLRALPPDGTLVLVTHLPQIAELIGHRRVRHCVPIVLRVKT
jgi:phosphohistidine phosphatase SixA